jgi:hypothetical protein
VTFISQPYYVDYGIDQDKWAFLMKDILIGLQSSSKIVKIKFHPRDTDSFKKNMLDFGFNETSEISVDVVGFFSTLLFELALNGRKVTLKHECLTSVLPSEYFRFTSWATDHLISEYVTDLPIDLRVESFINSGFFN